MERRDDLPPAQTIRPVDAPPDSSSPTTAQLKADIDSGRAGDKIAVFDPGLSPLGTDDEAAGMPAGPDRIRLARMTEGKGTGSAAYAAWHADPVLVAFVGGIMLIGCLIVGGMIWGRSW